MAKQTEHAATDVLWPMLVDAAGAVEARAATLAEMARQRPMATLAAAVALGYLAGLARRVTAASRA